MYSAVYKKFSEGGCIGIFPEGECSCRRTLSFIFDAQWLPSTGGSHDRTDFLPLKHGLAIMALGAMAANPECKVKIVPVGVSTAYPHFASSVSAC